MDFFKMNEKYNTAPTPTPVQQPVQPQPAAPVQQPVQPQPAAPVQQPVQAIKEMEE